MLLIKILKKLPFIKNIWIKFKQKKHFEMIQMEKESYKREFAGDCYGCFEGVYETFIDARFAAPTTKSNNYDSHEQAMWDMKLLKSHFEELQPYDYPVLSWMYRICKFANNNYNILDFGGNVAAQFYAYRKALPQNFIRKWIVYDLPKIIAVGEEFKKCQEASELHFTNKMPFNDEFDLLLMLGSIQYVEDATDPSYLITKFKKKPKYIIINRTPLLLNNQTLTVTLQNVHKTFSPMYAYNYDDFFNCFNKLGYELIDVWKDFSCKCVIPHEKRLEIPYYHGACLKLLNH